MSASENIPLAHRCAAVLAALAERAPRVQCLTNTVAQPITANLLHAMGVRASMATHAAEIRDIARTADALLINLGTLDAERELAIPVLLADVDTARQPVVLDPVFVELSPLRRSLAMQVLAKPGIILRGNEREMAALAEASLPSTVRITTGAIDVVRLGSSTVRIANGHPWMAQVTGMGCATGALIAACAAVEKDPIIAAAAALVAVGLAGEIAAERSRGPGSFAACLIDAAASLDAATIIARAKLS